MAYRSKVAIVFLLGFFLDLINMFIASVAFPTMAVAFHSSAPALAWVSNGYIAGMTLVIPFSALITRRLGAKRLFILSLTLFCIAATAAGMSDSLNHLIFWRVLQGAGGGLLIPVGQALAWQQFKPHERAGLSTAVMLVALLAPACAPALGGVLIQFFHWRWIFFAPLPLAVITLLLACLWLKNETAQPSPARLLHFPLLSDPLLRFSMLVYLCVPGIFIGVNVVGLFYLQSVAKMTPAATGALMLPWSLASFIAISATGKYFNRLGPRPLIITGGLLQAAGIAGLTTVSAATPESLTIALFVLMGAGGSLCSSTAQSTAFLNVAFEEMPDASALWNFNRQLSFFLGATLLALILSTLQQFFTPTQAWHGVFILSSVITLLPIMSALRLNNQQVLMHLHKETS
ncbi:MAG TPA: MFS transporter [Lelliottia sp.]|jgi:MFS family permease